MQCRSCRHDNPVGARFCVACGTRLAIACAACGVELPEGARFCPACGGAIEATRATGRRRTAPMPTRRATSPSSILTSRAALEGERKPVTVLFCDLVGLHRPGRAARARRHARPPQPLLRDRRWPRSTATRAPSTSSSAMASWRSSARRWRTRITRGAPPWPRSASPARSTGPLALDSGAQGRRSACAWGSTPGSSSSAPSATTCAWTTPPSATARIWRRACSRAPRPARSSLSQATARLIEDHVALEPFGTLDVRGPQRARHAHSGSSVPPQPAPTRRAGGRARSRFVGREREIGHPARAHRRGRREGHGRVAGVVGEPGVGKSRLLLELQADVGEQRHVARGPLSLVRRARSRTCRSWTCCAASAASPTDPPERAAEKVRATLQTLGLDPRRARRAPASPARARRSPMRPCARWAARSWPRARSTRCASCGCAAAAPAARARRRGRALDRPRLRDVPGGPRREPLAGRACCS